MRKHLVRGLAEEVLPLCMPAVDRKAGGESSPPLGRLQHRVVRLFLRPAGTLQVTTLKALAARAELEFYPIAALLAKGQTAGSVVERIKARIGGDSWSEAGGPGVISYDAPSQCLIVVQSQPIQRAIPGLLAEKPN
jgi:hypothetical protein